MTKPTIKKSKKATMSTMVTPPAPVLTWQQKNKEMVMEKIHRDLDFTIDGFMTSPRGDFRWLSNYGSSPIVYENWVVPTAEHLYHMFKTTSYEEKVRIMSDPNPIAAKREGQKVTLRPGWDSMKNEVMEFVLRLKFARDSVLGDKLKETFPRDLVETNYWNDVWWGVCHCQKCNGKGLNNLGIILMKIREELMQPLESQVL